MGPPPPHHTPDATQTMTTMPEGRGFRPVHAGGGVSIGQGAFIAF